MIRRAAKTDRNQGLIVEALRDACCAVQTLHAVGGGCPDLLVSRAGKNYLLEVKADEAQRRRKSKTAEKQQAWRAVWRGPVAVVTSVDEALRAVGLI